MTATFVANGPKVGTAVVRVTMDGEDVFVCSIPYSKDEVADWNLAVPECLHLAYEFAQEQADDAA